MSDDNPQLSLARRYIENTGVSIFLTGKAGTGKTTFLHRLDAELNKRHVVVAPTGVAAINAGGVTIHSFFQLPFDPYLPDVKELVTEYQMPSNYRTISRMKRDIIRTLEVLIIDEISMVRADLLDAIDHTLRRYRRSSLPFGGVQLLMIGDVHQLPPVVTEQEKPYMDRVYPSPFFFHSKALQRLKYVTIELTTVYRQQERQFVELLNRVRDNNLDAATLHALNKRVQSPREEAITLTTHNHQADAINKRRMKLLTGERRVYTAVVEGNYPDSAQPAARELELRVGERVMFLKNDSSGAHRYYNGKLGTVEGYREDGSDDVVVVRDDDGIEIEVARERWESLRYTINPKNNQIQQEVEGTFSQYPLRAAWAVTIHKAQGLTFDKVNINAAEAFAFGQVYVALSRCRTLQGLTLTSPLTERVTIGDEHVSHFTTTQAPYDQVASAIAEHEEQYLLTQLCRLFSVESLLRDVGRLEEHYKPIQQYYPTKAERLHHIVDTLTDLEAVGQRFQRQLLTLAPDARTSRTAQGANYYATQLSPLVEQLDTILDVDVDNKEVRKRIQEAGDAASERLGEKVACIGEVCRNGFDVVRLQKASTDFLLGKQNDNHPPTTSSPRKPATDDSMPHAPLVTLLKQWRLEKAQQQGVSAYIVLQQKALLSIATHLPTSVADLRRLTGIGPKTIERYGKELLDVVAEYIEAYGIPTPMSTP